MRHTVYSKRQLITAPSNVTATISFLSPIFRISTFVMAPDVAAANAAAKASPIVFFHPDLGIGGAERLVVDAAVGLQELGHRVVIFTNHCDPSHCFDECRDGRNISKSATALSANA